MIDYLLKNEPERMDRKGMIEIFDAAHELRYEIDHLSDPGVDGEGLSGRSDSATQKAGATAVFPRSGTQRLAVLEEIHQAGQTGITDELLCAALDMNYSRVGPRRRELVEGGWVKDSGRTRDGSSGTEVTLWVLTDKAREHFANVAVGV